MYQIMLKTKKYSTEIRTDGESGLEEALTDIYDLIILDVMLPHKKGFEILKELKEENTLLFCYNKKRR